jgi:RND family efflux transporter MFP subunit
MFVRYLLSIILTLASGSFVLAQDFPPANVNVTPAQMTTLRPTAWVSGEVVSPNNSRIAAEVSGRIEQLAELGAKVKQGDLIAKIDDSRLKLRRDETKATVQSNQSRYQFLASEVKRVQSLAERNLSAKTELDRIISERDVARSELAEAKSRLAQIEQDIEFSSLKAPFDGLVTHRLSNIGEFVQSGVGIIQMVETANIEASVFAPITNYPYISSNMVLDVDSAMGQFQAPLKAIIPVAESRTGLMQLRLDLTESKWPIGLKVKVAVPNAEAKEVLAIPRDALVLRRDGISVFIIRDNIAEQVSVEVGIGQGQLVEVIGELNPGDLVVVRGAERLQPGQQVAIKESNERLVSGNL